MRRYGQLIADEARRRPGWTVREVDAGLLDEGSGRLAQAGRRARRAPTSSSCSGTGAAGARHGRSLARLARFRRAYRGALVVTLHDIFERQGLRERYLQPEAWSLR